MPRKNQIQVVSIPYWLGSKLRGAFASKPLKKQPGFNPLLVGV